LKLVVFEDDGLGGFGPLVSMKHLGQLNRGTKTLLDGLRESIADATDLTLWGRDYLADACGEALGEVFNERAEGLTTFVNARAKPGRLLLELTSRRTPFAAMAGNQLVVARVTGVGLRPGLMARRDSAEVGKRAERLQAPADSLFNGFWELVQTNGLAIAEQARHMKDQLSLPNTVEVRGPRSNLRVHGRADVEFYTTFDTRLGPIIVEEGAYVESFSRVMGPCFIGPGTKVHSAMIGGGTSIFDGCRIGGQVENSIIMSQTNKSHNGYVGDSYVGEWVNLGAGSTFSNLKNTYGNIKLDLVGKRIDSGMLKLGSAVGDMSKVSIGTQVYCGKFLGTGCHIAGFTKRNVPSFTYSDGFGKMVELLIESVLDTQRRVMERRGKTLTRTGEALIRHAFKNTSVERQTFRVSKGRLE